MKAAQVICKLRERGLVEQARIYATARCVTLGEMCSMRKEPRALAARRAFWRWLKAKGLSSSEIARLFGCSHTTVLAAGKSQRVSPSTSGSNSNHSQISPSTSDTI